MKKILLLITIFILFPGCTTANLIAKRTEDSKITILDQHYLEYDDKKHIPFSEISDIAYNQKSRELFMLGDKGYLYRFSVDFNKKIENLKYIDAFRLREPKRRDKKYDSEGLTYNSKKELIISFERRARISKLSPKGMIKSDYKLPKKLRKQSIYRDRNKIFEAVASHPKYGILTVAEYPIRKRAKRDQTIYSLGGREWHFRAEKYKNSAVTAIEVMDDGNILVLERAYSGLSHPLMITLKKVYIDNCDRKNRCKSKALLSFDSFANWDMSNFEGLARVGKNRFVMVSDNNANFFLPTTLIYFEVK